MSQLNPEDWQRFWDEGNVTTFEKKFLNGYDGSILSFWADNLCGKYTPVIDLCCGNGALAWTVRDALEKKSIKTKITGVDIASIDPFSSLKFDKQAYPDIAFEGNISIEEMPFNPKSFGLAISQYGIEYSNLERSIPEVSRVLKDEARVALIVHSERSDIVINMSRFLDIFKECFQTGQLGEKFLALDEIFRRHLNFEDLRSDANYKRMVGKLNRETYPITNKYLDVFSHLPIRPLATPEELAVHYIERLFAIFQNRRIDDTSRKHDLEILIGDVETAISRAEDLTSARLTEPEIKKMHGLLAIEGFKIEKAADLKYGEKDENFGYALVAER